MEAKSFISHTEDGGTDVGKIIQDQLIRPDLEMKSFLSQNTIDHGEHIPQKILEFLIETDVLFVVLEPLVIGSKWVRWEYDFCNKRGIRIIPIAFDRFYSKLNRIEWIDTFTKYLIYDGNDGKFRNEVWNDIDDIKGTLEARALERKSIELKVPPEERLYSELEKIKISGKVKTALIGTAYLHMPFLGDDYPPIITKEISTPITPNSEGNFEFEFKLHSSPVKTQSIQKWFIELRFDKKSKLIPIAIKVRDGDEGTPSEGESSGVPETSQPSEEGGADTKEIKEKINFVSKGTHQSIPRTIKGQTIARDDKISEIVSLLDENDRVVVTGDKGSGKSVLMCQLYEKLAQLHTVLFLRCDDYLGIESFEGLNENIISGYSFVDSIQDIATESDKMIIIFDSLDAISRNEESMNVFKHFLKNIWGTKKVQTISSVRSYDYEYSPSINTTDWGIKYPLELFKTEELDRTLAELDNPKISDELKKILSNPLHLKLLSLILERSPNADFTNIKNEIELYDEHWNEYVEKLESSTEVRNTLFDIAQTMSSLQRISIPYSDFDNPKVLQEILSRNIVLRDESNDLISFFHHVYLDYAISRFILAKHGKFVDYLQKDEYNVFLRPTIVFALSILHKRDPRQSIKVIEGILNSELKYFWKISTLTALAKINKSDEQDFSKLDNFLTEKVILQRHFLMEITKQKNYFWFDLWKDSIFLKWSSFNNPNSWFIVDYLRSIVERIDDHQSIFKIIQLLVENSTHGWTKRKSVELLTEIDTAGKVDWLNELSTNEDTDIRNGVVETLPRLIETDPKSVPDIFCNLFTYVETSDKKTQLPSHGTFTMTSTKRQDNHMVIWRAGELFPELLKKNPKQMIISAIKIFEILRKEELKTYKGSVIEDHGCVWFKDFNDLYDENKILNQIIGYIQNCKDDKLNELIPLFKSTKLATFHSILIDELIKRRDRFAGEIFKIISNPEVYEIITLRRSIRSAIKTIISSINPEQISNLLDNVMNVKLTDRELDEEYLKVLNRVKAEFLSDFPTEVLRPEHIEIISKFSKPDLKYEPPYKFEVEVGKEPKEITAKPEPEEIITNSLGKELEHRGEIELLEAISEYLDKKTEELDNTKIQPIKEFLISNKNDPDPEENAVDKEDHSLISHYSTIRGLTAKCLIQLLYHTKDSSLVPLIKELSDDPINKVRGEIGRALNYLFYYDYDLTFSIVEKYSVDSDPRVQFFLSHVLGLIIHKNPKHATLIINNILSTLPSNYQGIENFLIFLAFNKKEPDAITLLNNIVDKQLFSSEIRCNIPFSLKGNYLFKDEFQDQSLDLLYRLLDDPDHEVREKAAFFTLHSFEKDEHVKNEEFIKKISKHLDRIVSEVDRESWDPRLIEELIRFLEKFWNLLPEKTIDYLKKLINDRIKDYTAFQPVIARESVKILNGLFQHPSLSKKNRKRCLNILDTYAMAGWNEALELLSAMERPD